VNERTVSRAIVAFTVALAVGTLFFFWAELNWKNLGSRSAVAAVTLAGAALGAFFAQRMARRPTPIDWIHELVRTAMLVALVVGTGMLVAHLGDLSPGAAPSHVPNNQPTVSTRLFTTLMAISALLASSSVLPIWRHRHAVRTAADAPLSETLAACGAWLSLVVVVLGALGLIARVDLLRVLVPHASLVLALLVACVALSLGRAPRRLERTPLGFVISGGALATASLISGLTGFPIPGRDEHRDGDVCVAARHPGLFCDARATRATAYRARGVELRRVECRSTFQYNDERFLVVVGRDPTGRDHRGAELFVRVVGTPLERARAACEMLLSDRCQAPLSYPSELAGFTGLPARNILVPHESAGRLTFLAVTHEYPHGRSTTAGRRRIAVPYEVELATGRIVEAR
jgi:hypothetical protein